VSAKITIAGGETFFLLIDGVFAELLRLAANNPRILLTLVDCATVGLPVPKSEVSFLLDEKNNYHLLDSNGRIATAIQPIIVSSVRIESGKIWLTHPVTKVKTEGRCLTGL